MSLKYFSSILYLFFLFSSFLIPEKDRVVVYIFLGEECVISQHYTLQLRALHEQFVDKNIEFKGYFPNPNSTMETVDAFKEKYQVPFDIKLDKAQLQMMKFGVQVTPEVVVFKPETQEVLYQGRIDNTYFQVGKRRRVTTTFELKDALIAIQNNKKIAVEKTEVIGCFITLLDPNFKGIPMCQPKG
mgnify:CR=1 FL=1